jgi:ribosome biogenesis GTPase
LSSVRTGQVIRVDRKQCHVLIGEATLLCSLRGRFFEEESEEKSPVAVGDQVEVKQEGDEGVIERVLPRRTQVARPTPRQPRQRQVMAANVDVLVAMATLRQPKVRTSLVDRLLAAAEAARLEGLVVLNKIDLCKAEEVESFRSRFESLGYPTFAISVQERSGLDALDERLRGKLTILLGHSGVGKSSLLNAFDPTLDLKTGALTRRHDKGSHTTTHSSLIRLPQGALVVDCPGIREFGLTDVTPAELGHHFVDLRPFHHQCRYPDCTHAHEPDCAVRIALESGKIRPDRYENYRRLLDELQGGGERMPRHGSFS